MTDLTLNPGVAALPAGDKQIAMPLLAGPAVRRRGEQRARRRLTARVLHSTDGGFRLFRIY